MMNQRRPTQSRRQASVDYPRYPPQSQLQPQVPQASDYESDNPAYASDYPSHTAPAPRTNDELNLSVLRRHNTDITSILSIAPYAVIYDFSPIPEPTWSKTGIEGSLFICQLTSGTYGEDRYIAIVLNRRGLDNFSAELREGDNAGVEITDPFVIVSYNDTHEQKINGIFIFSEGHGSSTEKTRELNADLMKQLAVQAGLSRKAAEAAASQATAKHTNGHLQEAEALVESSQMGAPMGREISLQELFGQQRAEDASWSVRAHNLDGAGDQQPTGPTLGRSEANPVQRDILTNLFRGAGGQRPTQAAVGGSRHIGPAAPPPGQQDILGDLFRRAGIGMR